MHRMSIDIETYSDIELKKAGVYRYSESPNFTILLFGYSIDGGPVQVIDLTSGECMPKEIIHALYDRNVLKWAFNAQFERVCLSRYLGVWIPPESWRCSMVWAATLGLPLSLADVGSVLGLEKQKLTEGKDLVRFFCQPCKPTQSNNGRTRNRPHDAPDKWAQFIAYNIRDVEAEMSIQAALTKHPVPESEWDNYALDQRINDRGIALDMQLVEQAIRCDEAARSHAMHEARVLTGLDNPNSPQQLIAWLNENGVETGSLDKKTVAELLSNNVGTVAKILEYRRELAKSSVKKYTAMQAAVCADGRAHGLIQFYGASRTGRFAGRLVQVQNLPQNHLPDLALARDLVRDGRFEDVEMLYASTPSVLSELIRTAFVPKPGTRFYVADFSAIEARVIAWLAGESWRLQVFQGGGDIYCASASQMFHVPVEKHGVNAHLRQKGKISELALGYGGSTGALKAMGALEMGVPEDELAPLVKSWRAANPRIVKLWWDIDAAVTQTVRDQSFKETHGIRFEYAGEYLFIRLPSGRRLAYREPAIVKNRFGNESVSYAGSGESRKWMRIESYGPKFTENIVQAIARDLLVEAMQRLDKAGYEIVMHVHDEAVIEATPETRLERICTIMGETPAWAAGLPLRADGYVCDFYQKD